MNLNFTHAGSRRCIIILIGLLTGGCATCLPLRTVRFQVVDANTREPLEGVRTQRTSMDRTMGFVIFGGKDGTFDLRPTGHDGTVVARNLCSNQMHHFTFSKSGYLETGVEGSNPAEIGVPLPPSDPHHTRMGTLTHANDRGLVVILMYPATTAVAKYEPVWQRADNAPDQIIAVAEAQCRKERHISTDVEWHKEPGTLQVWKNQYGDYCILWVARKRDLPGMFQWEWVRVIPPDTLYGYGIGGAPGPQPPTTRRIGWGER